MITIVKRKAQSCSDQIKPEREKILSPSGTKLTQEKCTKPQSGEVERTKQT